MDVSHGRSARMSFDTAREMAKTLTPAQEIAHIENELRALGYTKTHQPVKEALTIKNPQVNPSTKTLEEFLFLSPRLTKKCTFFLLPQPKRHRKSLRSAVGFRERFSPPGLQTRRER